MSADVQDMFCRPTEERALISYCMRSMDHYFSICSKLSPSDFLYPQHEMFMLLFESLAAKGAERFETNLVIAEATASGVLESIGGVKYIQTISSMNVDPVNIELFMTTVCEATTKYKLYCMLNDKIRNVAKNAKDGAGSIDLISNTESDILSLTMSNHNMNEPINLSTGLRDYIEELKDNSISLSGLSTGYPILDKQIDGMVNGTLLVIAARKKMGKSTLLSNIAAHAAYKLGEAVLYVDTELSFNEWRPRVLSMVSGVKERDIKHGGYDEHTYSKLQRASSIIEKGKLFHEYMPGYSVDKLVALFKKYKHKEKIGLIVFDYLKEPDSSSLDRQRKEYQVLGDVTTKIKDLAGKLDIPAITAVQVNRDGDVADSDRIARYADVICFWETRKNEEMVEGGLECGTHKLIIRDTRRGGATSTQGIGYRFNKEYMTIREVPIDKQYFTNFDKVVNSDSSNDIDTEDSDGYLNEKL